LVDENSSMMLRQIGSPLAKFSRGVVLHIKPGDQDLTGRDWLEAKRSANQARFAGAIPPHEGHNLTGVRGQVHIAQHGCCTVSDRHPTRGNSLFAKTFHWFESNCGREWVLDQQTLEIPHRGWSVITPDLLGNPEELGYARRWHIEAGRRDICKLVQVSIGNPPETFGQSQEAIQAMLGHNDSGAEVSIQNTQGMHQVVRTPGIEL